MNKTVMAVFQLETALKVLILKKEAVNSTKFSCRRHSAPLDVLLPLPTLEVLLLLDPPCPPGPADDAQVDSAVGTLLTSPPKKHSAAGATSGNSFLLERGLVYLLLLPFSAIFHDGQRGHTAAGLHVGLPGIHRLHNFHHHGGMESLVLRGRQHRHGSGHVRGAVEDLRVSEHRPDSVQSV